MLLQIHGVNLHSGMVMVLHILMQISTIWLLETTILQKKFLETMEVFITANHLEHLKKFPLEILNFVTTQFYTIGVAPSEMFKDLNKQVSGEIFQITEQKIKV